MVEHSAQQLPAQPYQVHVCVPVHMCVWRLHAVCTVDTLQVVFYYISQSKANNHAVREAACAVIAELMEKVDKRAVSPHVPDLLRALLLCFKDSSWPVRDAACTACGRCGRSWFRRIHTVELTTCWRQRAIYFNHRFHTTSADG